MFVWQNKLNAPVILTIKTALVLYKLLTVVIVCYKTQHRLLCCMAPITLSEYVYISFKLHFKNETNNAQPTSVIVNVTCIIRDLAMQTTS